MDFIEKLPMSHGKSVIMVVFDRLSKCAYFMHLSHPFNASQVAQVFLDGVYKLHGLPESIVSDRGDSRVESVDRTLLSREEAVNMLNHMQVIVRQRQQHKLSAKYYGPFMIVERIGEEAYKLHLQSHRQLHLVFRISQLKKCHGKEQQMGSLPQLREDGLLAYRPLAILERRLGKLNNKPVMFPDFDVATLRQERSQVRVPLGTFTPSGRIGGSTCGFRIQHTAQLDVTAGPEPLTTNKPSEKNGVDTRQSEEFKKSTKSQKMLNLFWRKDLFSSNLPLNIL
ncbi:retrotransposable element Tf2 [Tanacetum coccineum]